MRKLAAEEPAMDVAGSMHLQDSGSFRECMN